MRIVGVDYTPAYAQYAGIGRLVRNQIAALAQIDTRNEYKLFVAGKHDASDIAPNMRIYRSRISDVWLARIWHRLHLPVPMNYWLGKLDLFHATDFVLPPLLSSTKALLTVHDLTFIRSPGAAPEKLVNYLNRVVPDSLARATHIIADSEATKSDLIEIYRVAPADISVVLSGVEVRFFEKSVLTPLIRQKYHLPDAPYLFSVGTVQPRKNYTRAIEALKLVRDEGLDIHYVISGGKGWSDNPIHQKVRDLGLQDFVHFVGFVDEDDLPAMYQAARVVLYPSLYEGFGLPILEAMAGSVPVVTSDISSMPEVAGDAALLVDPFSVPELADSIRRITESDTLRAELIASGLARAHAFTWEKSARSLKQVYDQFLTD